jgi:hypothetical protein
VDDPVPARSRPWIDAEDLHGETLGARADVPARERWAPAGGKMGTATEVRETGRPYRRGMTHLHPVILRMLVLERERELTAAARRARARQASARPHAGLLGRMRIRRARPLSPRPAGGA